jgi:hypothetical protein
VQVDLGCATEAVVVQLTQPNSRLVDAAMTFPLGLVLEQGELHQGFVSVEDVRA